MPRRLSILTDEGEIPLTLADLQQMRILTDDGEVPLDLTGLPLIADDPASFVAGLGALELATDNSAGSSRAGAQSGATTIPSSQPSPAISLSGGSGSTSEGTAIFSIPGVGQVTIYAINNNRWESGGSAGFAVKLTQAAGSPCSDLQWSQRVRITINNRAMLTDDQYYSIVQHETLEHGGNDPFGGYVPDNGYNEPKIHPDPNDPFAPPPGYKSPNRYAPSLAASDWPDRNHSFAKGDVAFGDWPFLPYNPRANQSESLPYPKGTDVTKDFILTLNCNGQPVGPDIHWSVRGAAGSGQTSTVNVTLVPR